MAEHLGIKSKQWAAILLCTTQSTTPLWHHT